MTGTKDDKQKPMPRLVLGTMARALLEVSKVATFGAEKYSPDNWLKVENGLDRYTDAKDRHRLEGAISEYDSESGLLHAAHEAWNALAVLELKLRAAGVVTESDWPSEEHIESVGRYGNECSAKKQYRDLEKPWEWQIGDYAEVDRCGVRSGEMLSGTISDIFEADDGILIFQLDGVDGWFLSGAFNSVIEKSAPVCRDHAVTDWHESVDSGSIVVSKTKHPWIELY